MAKLTQPYEQRKEILALAKLMAEEPFLNQTELAERVKRSRSWVNGEVNKPEFQALLEKFSNDIWSRNKIRAMRTCEKMAERGQWKAVEFLLRANGINPEQRIAMADDIFIDIKKDEGRDN